MAILIRTADFTESELGSQLLYRSFSRQSAAVFPLPLQHEPERSSSSGSLTAERGQQSKGILKFPGSR